MCLIEDIWIGADPKSLHVSCFDALKIRSRVGFSTRLAESATGKSKSVDMGGRLNEKLFDPNLARFLEDLGGVVAAPRRIETLYWVRHSFFREAADEFAIFGYPIWIAAAD